MKPTKTESTESQSPLQALLSGDTKSLEANKDKIAQGLKDILLGVALGDGDALKALDDLDLSAIVAAKGAARYPEVSTIGYMESFDVANALKYCLDGKKISSENVADNFHYIVKTIPGHIVLLKRDGKAYKVFDSAEGSRQTVVSNLEADPSIKRVQLTVLKKMPFVQTTDAWSCGVCVVMNAIAIEQSVKKSIKLDHFKLSKLAYIIQILSKVQEQRPLIAFLEKNQREVDGEIYYTSLPKQKDIASLKLSLNNADLVGLPDILKGLKEYTSITSITLHSDDITAENLKLLLNELTKNTKLKNVVLKLNIKSKDISEDISNEIASFLQTNENITYFKLDCECSEGVELDEKKLNHAIKLSKSLKNVEGMELDRYTQKHLEYQKEDYTTFTSFADAAKYLKDVIAKLETKAAEDAKKAASATTGSEDKAKVKKVAEAEIKLPTKIRVFSPDLDLDNHSYNKWVSGFADFKEALTIKSKENAETPEAAAEIDKQNQVKLPLLESLTHISLENVNWAHDGNDYPRTIFGRLQKCSNLEFLGISDFAAIDKEALVPLGGLLIRNTKIQKLDIRCDTDPFKLFLCAANGNAAENAGAKVDSLNEQLTARTTPLTLKCNERPIDCQEEFDAFNTAAKGLAATVKTEEDKQETESSSKVTKKDRKKATVSSSKVTKKDRKKATVSSSKAGDILEKEEDKQEKGSPETTVAHDTMKSYHPELQSILEYHKNPDQAYSDHVPIYTEVEGVKLVSWNVWEPKIVSGFAKNDKLCVEEDAAAIEARYDRQIGALEKFIKNQDPDFILLQEVSSDMQTLLDDKFEGWGLYSNNAGQVILYRTDKYQFVTAEKYGESDGYSASFGAAIGRFQRLSDNKVVRVASIQHTWTYKISETERNIQTFFEKAADADINIIMGDFNKCIASKLDKVTNIITSIAPSRFYDDATKTKTAITQGIQAQWASFIDGCFANTRDGQIKQYDAQHFNPETGRAYTDEELQPLDTNNMNDFQKEQCEMQRPIISLDTAYSKKGLFLGGSLNIEQYEKRLNKVFGADSFCVRRSSNTLNEKGVALYIKNLNYGIPQGEEIEKFPINACGHDEAQIPIVCVTDENIPALEQALQQMAFDHDKDLSSFDIKPNTLLFSRAEPHRKTGLFFGSAVDIEQYEELLNKVFGEGVFEVHRSSNANNEKGVALYIRNQRYGVPSADNITSLADHIDKGMCVKRVRVTDENIPALEKALQQMAQNNDLECKEMPLAAKVGFVGSALAVLLGGSLIASSHFCGLGRSCLYSGVGLIAGGALLSIFATASYFQHKQDVKKLIDSLYDDKGSEHSASQQL